MTSPPEFSDQFVSDFETLLRWRRDVREFAGDPVPQSVLNQCLELANLSPSVGLSQPWRFVQVQSPGARDTIIRSFEQCNKEALNSYDGDRAKIYARLKLEGLREAPCQFAVFCDMETDQGHGLGRSTMPEMLNYSAVMAIHTFWLAARTRGLGVGWVSILAPDEVRRACEVPESWQLIGYLCVGWPKAESDTPKLETDGWEQRRDMLVK